jgi:hypothetical protein
MHAGAPAPPLRGFASVDPSSRPRSSPATLAAALYVCPSPAASSKAFVCIAPRANAHESTLQLAELWLGRREQIHGGS